MKTIITTLLIVFAFSVNAQTKEEIKDAKKQAKKEKRTEWMERKRKREFLASLPRDLREDSIAITYVEYDKENVPYEIDDQENIVFSKVFDFKGESKEELYIKAKTFVVEKFIGGEMSEQVDDKEEGRYASSAIERNLFNAALFITEAADLKYTLLIDVKDEKVRFRVKAYAYRYRFASSYQKTDVDYKIPTKYPINQDDKRNKSFFNYTHAKMISFCLQFFDMFEDYMNEESVNDWN